MSQYLIDRSIKNSFAIDRLTEENKKLVKKLNAFQLKLNSLTRKISRIEKLKSNRRTTNE